SLLGLDVPTTRDALGIAYAQAASNMQAVHDGALVKRMHPGFGARAGITAALLAARGLTGARHVLEGPYGYLHLYERGAYRRERVPGGPRGPLEGTPPAPQPSPCPPHPHPALHAAPAPPAHGGRVPPRPLPLTPL